MPRNRRDVTQSCTSASPGPIDLRIAVIVPCHNYGAYLAEALRSLDRQTVVPSELLIIDDASTDDTQAVLADILPQLCVASRVIKHERRRGLVASLVDGIAATTAPFIAHVDADDTCESHYLEALLTALSDASHLGFAYPKMRLFGAESGIYYTHSFDIPRLLFEGNYIPHIALMRREAFEATRGYRNLVTHIDWDLWLSFAEVGWPGVLVNEVLYNWRRHPEAMTYQPTGVRLCARLDILRVHWRLALRHLPWILPWTLAAVWRRIRLRMPGRPRAYLTKSGWVEARPRA